MSTPDRLMLLNAWCPMHNKLDQDDEPIENTSEARLQFVPLPNDPVHDAWVCSLPPDQCSWFILVSKHETAAGNFMVQK